MKIVTLFLLLICSCTAARANKLKTSLHKTGRALIVLGHKPWFVPIEHMALGASIEIAVSNRAGGPQKYQAGLLAASLVASFKEGADVLGHKDTKKSAALDTSEILAGAVAAAGVRH